MNDLITPSPFLRDRLLAAATGLKADAEIARLNLANAEQDVAAARALLEEAEAHRDAQQAAVDGLVHDIAWCEQQAATRTAPDPDAAHAATGLMPTEPRPAEPAQIPHPVKLADLPESQRLCGYCGGSIYHNRLLGQWEHTRDGEALCDMEDPDEHCADPTGDLPFNVVQAPADVVAALTGGTLIITDEPPRIDTVQATTGTGAGELVAVHGPGTTGPLDPAVTRPDAGLAHPVPNPPGPPGEARHAKPKHRGSRLTGPFRALTARNDQDGDNA